MPITTNTITAGWSGAFGKQVVFRQIKGKTYTSAYPQMGERVLSPKQLKVNALMKLANTYAQSIMDDEEQRNKARLRLDVPMKKLYTTLIKEFYKKNYSPDDPVVVDSAAAGATAGSTPLAASVGASETVAVGTHEAVAVDTPETVAIGAFETAVNFIVYLLQTTEKTDEEIATMVKVPVEFVKQQHIITRK